MNSLSAYLNCRMARRVARRVALLGIVLLVSLMWFQPRHGALAQSDGTVASEPGLSPGSITPTVPERTRLQVDTDPEHSPCVIDRAPARSYLRGPDNLAQESLEQRAAGTKALLRCTIYQGDRLNLSFYLTTADNQPIRNRAVTLYMEGEKVRRVRTDDAGVALFPSRLELPLGTYVLHANYGGSEVLTPAQAIVHLVVVPLPVTIQIVPPLAGIRFALDGHEFASNDQGLAVSSVPTPGSYALELLTDSEDRGDYRIKFDRWRVEKFDRQRVIDVPIRQPLEVGYMVSYPVFETFTDLDGRLVDTSRIESWSYLSSHGALETFTDHERHWVDANRIMRRRFGLEYVPIQYSLVSVMVDGSNVINKKQQRFYADAPNTNWPISLIFFAARFAPQDALFGVPIGNGIELTYPDGETIFHPADAQGIVALDALARGAYTVRAMGASGIAPETPVAITRYQDVPLRVVSQLDIGLALALGMALALSLLLLGRPHLIQLAYPRTWLTAGLALKQHLTTSMLLKLICILGGAMLLLLGGCAAAPKTQPDPVTEALVRYRDPATKPPVLAYYYIWFDPTSWDRAKTDYPLLGRYSSFDRSAMRQHIRWAQAAGIDGFIVSWKSGDDLNERLATLADIATQEEFQLVLIYQGLDFEREPISIDKVAADLDYFAATYADHPAFTLFGKPVVIWGGTWAYTTDDIAATVAPVKPQLQVLASERNVEGYLRLATIVDGDAYYWGAANPDTYPNYPGKLIEMGEVVHAHGGLWIPPAAPGFDARLVGGTSIVTRADGEMLRRQLAGAVQSAPDAVGIISWNEFSENSHIEPSEAYGMRYLQVVGEVLGANPEELAAPATRTHRRPPVSIAYSLPGIILLCILLGGSIVYRYQRQQHRQDLRTSLTE